METRDQKLTNLTQVVALTRMLANPKILEETGVRVVTSLYFLSSAAAGRVAKYHEHIRVEKWPKLKIGTFLIEVKVGFTFCSVQGIWHLATPAAGSKLYYCLNQKIS